MSKQVQVNLSFNADTSKAKAQINDLVSSLNKISTKDSQIFDDKGLKDAANAAKDLTRHLEASVNVNTGKLDLNKFTQSLVKSKTNLTDLYNQLSKAGPEGQKAFSQLSSAIASSDSSILNLNSKVKDLGQTLKNTIKWQLSSSLVHGFMGAMSQAVGYAKDLNSSLNDIRIVTGASVDEMARFAEQANKSAKALSSTTTEYTKASLIYYQQGLSASEVKERTDVTIKMANVSKESAQVVSDQMTAVWNNFYDGSKSLEYYADVMTALGAATASSVDEIAGGLEKFAAIGDTIGLSYEYAASALATITSNTRQSEEVVGTALKTIFARIQGLNLGETLDDGTTLNKYSAALDKVGISIFDQAGEIKNMDNILSEMGNKWQDLSKDQQIALAQTVAGTRQYTQLVALMDNWDNGDNDSFQTNLSTAYGSEGALQKQQEIYAESWEAAADRVKAAMEDIYDSLLNDEAIIVLLNGLEKILDFTGALIDGFGGLKGILLMVGGIFARQFANEVPEAIGKLKQNFEILTGKGQENKINMLEETAALRKPGENGPKEGTGAYTRAMADSQQAAQMAELERIHSQLTDAQYDSAKAKIDEARASQELVANLQDEIAEKEKLFKQNKRNVKAENGDKKVSDRIKELDEEIGSTDEDKQAAEELYRSTRAKKQSDLTADEAEWMANYERRKAELETLQQMDGTQTINQAIQGQMDKLSELYGKWSSLNQVIDDYQAQIESFGASADIIKNAGGINTEKGAQEFDELTNSMKNYLSLLGEIDGVNVNIDGFDEAVANIKKLENTEEAEKAIENLISSFHKFANIQIVDGQITQIGEEAIDAEGRMQKLENQIDEVRGALEGLTPEQFEKLAAAAEEAGIEIAGLKVALKQQQNTNQQKGTPTQSLPEMEFSTALTKVAGLGMDVASLFSSLGSALSVCFDEGTTAGEKFIAVLSSMPAAAMSIAQITGALKDMPEALKTVSEGFSKLKEFSVTGSGLATIFGNIGTKLGSTAIASTKVGGAIVSAFTGATTSVMSFWASLGLIAVALAAVVAVVWLVVKAFEAIQASTPEGKLKAAEEHTAAMAEAAKEANQAYQDLLNTINGYESAAGALDGLTKGTQEFTNKLIEANGQAQKLIDTYGISADQYSVNEDTGLIEFNEGVLESKQQEYQEQSEKSNSAYNGAKIAESQQKQENATGELRAELVSNGGNLNALNQTLENYYKAMQEAGDGTIEGFYALSEEDRKAALEGVETRYNYGQYNNNELIDNNIAALSDKKNLEAMQNYQNIYNKENNQQLSTLKNDLINNLSNETAYQNSDYKNAILDKAANIDNYNDIKNQAKQDYNAKKPQDLAEDFKEAFGEDQYEYDKGKIYKKNEDGTRGETIDKKTAVDMLASKDASDNMEQAALNFADIFNRIDASADDSEKTYLDSMLNDRGVNALSRDEIEKLQVDGPLSIEDVFDTATLNQLAEGGYGQEEIQAWLDSLNEQIANWKPELFNTDSWQKEYAAEKDALKGLEIGDTISAEDYGALSDAAKQYFVELADGTYRMIEDGNKVREIAEQSQRNTLEQGINDAKGSLNEAQSIFNNTDSGQDLDTATTKIENGQITEGSQVAADYIAAVNEALGIQATTAAEAAAAVREYQAAANEGGATLATMATSVTDLNNMLLNGSINAEQYQMGLKELGASYSNSQDEMQAYTNALESEDKATIKAAYDTLELATSAGELGEEYGYTGEEIESMAKQLKSQNKDLKTTGRAFSEMAKDQLRFNDALESSKENMKDWKKSVKAFEETGKLIPTEQIEEMRNAYGNLLDIDGSSLSEEFLTSSENLELMEKALDGNEDAYQELQALAGQEILQSVGIDTSKYESDLATLQGMAIDGKEWASIEAGASLNNEGFLNALTEMVNASGMTAQQATDYLSSMGVDAEVVEGDPVVTTEKGPASFDTQVNMVKENALVPVPDGSGGFTQEPIEVAFPEVTYTKGEQIEYEKETKGTGLKVISANKSSGGNIKSSGGGGGSKSGGGGGGGKKSEKKKMDKVAKSAVVKRYKRVDDKLDDKSAAIDKASRAMDKMYGASRIKSMQKYNQLLQEEIGLLETKAAEAKNYLEKEDLPELNNALKEALSKAGLSGLSFEIDEDGLITNYQEIMTALYNELDKQITAANNAGGADEETQKKIDELQAKIDAVNAAVEQYDETRELIEDLEADMAEKAMEIYDNQLETLSYSIELNLEVSDDSLALIDFQLSQIEDDAFKAAEAIALMGTKAATIEEKMAKTREALSALTAMTLDGEYTEEQMELIKQYRDELMDLAQEYMELRNSVEEQVMSTFEAWREEMDKGISTVEHYGSVLESYKNITDLLGKTISKSVSDDLYAKFNQGIVSNSIDQIEATKAAYEGIQEAQARAEAEYDAAIARGDEASAEMWKKTLSDLNEEAQAAQEAMLSAWESALSVIAEQFEESVERAVNAFREQFDDMSDKFSRSKETSDMFLKDYQQIYELSKLSRDINNSIDDTESLGGKKKLKGLLEEINKLQEDGVEMSQYDLEYLQKTYDLRLAEIELENAQNAKNTVRLSKDNEGNWSYVYTTNTDAVDQAQQKYEDALYSMQDLSSTYIDEMSEKLIATSQEMAEALASIRVEDFSSYQEYQDKVNEVMAEYQTQMELQEAELDKAIGNNKVLYEEDWSSYNEKTGYKISKTNEFVTSFRDSLLGSLMDSTTQSSNFMEVLSASAQTLVEALGGSGKEYFENIGAIMNAAGTSTDAFGKDATDAINATSDASKKAAEDVKGMANDMVDSFNTVSDSVVAWQKTYSKAITEALEDTESLVAMINAMNAGLVNGTGIPTGTSISTGTSDPETGDTSATDTSSEEETDASDYNVSAAEGIIKQLVDAGFTENMLQEIFGKEDITASIAAKLAVMDENSINIQTLSSSLEETLSNLQLANYENYEEYLSAINEIQEEYQEALQKLVTGQVEQEAYENDWQKLIEQVESAPEFLGEAISASMLPTLTEVIEKIGANASQMSLGVGQWAAQLIKDEFLQTLEQEVNITADFPNVSDHNEIEEAIRNLINTASQYANRK